MKLYELCNQSIIQGNVCIKVFTEEGTEKEARYYHDNEAFDTYCSDAYDLEDLEVTYIYPAKSNDGKPWLVIEVLEYHEV